MYEDVKVSTEKPAKRWDKMIDRIIALLIAGLLGYLMAQVGIGG